MVENTYRVGKTQWSKWWDEARIAFNEARAGGCNYAEAAEQAGYVQAGLTKKKPSVLDIIEEAAEAVVPAIAVARAVKRIGAKKKAN